MNNIIMLLSGSAVMHYHLTGEAYENVLGDEKSHIWHCMRTMQSNVSAIAIAITNAKPDKKARALCEAMDKALDRQLEFLFVSAQEVYRLRKGGAAYYAEKMPDSYADGQSHWLPEFRALAFDSDK